MGNRLDNMTADERQSNLNKKDNLQIRAHIAAKTDVKEHYQRLWTSIVVLKELVGLSDSTMFELQAKISSKIAECDISIRDHSKLL